MLEVVTICVNAKLQSSYYIYPTCMLQCECVPYCYDKIKQLVPILEAQIHNPSTTMASIVLLFLQSLTL
ncbi:hypothetical protein WN55_00742 [Dufourea novaeangliae]|uniref:Uncharacterized protein n=1 Tax=Dufourea novaeangliae TaxID=178035 RepID=A0A154PBB0_DUFNO|nr:hypothetical protein WN55_00742 [Dufourea novaeangliae]